MRLPWLSARSLASRGRRRTGGDAGLFAGLGGSVGEETLLQAAERHLLRLPAVHLALPGDLLLFRWKSHLPAKHCAVLVERFSDLSPPGRTPLLRGRIVHAYDAAGRVTECNLAAEWQVRIAAAFTWPGLSESARPFSGDRQQEPS